MLPSKPLPLLLSLQNAPCSPLHVTGGQTRQKPDDLHNDVSSAPWATPLVRDPRPFLPSRDQYTLSGTLASIQDEKELVAIGLMAADHDARSLAGALPAHVGSDA